MPQLQPVEEIEVTETENKKRLRSSQKIRRNITRCLSTSFRLLIGLWILIQVRESKGFAGVCCVCIMFELQYLLGRFLGTGCALLRELFRSSFQERSV